MWVWSHFLVLGSLTLVSLTWIFMSVNRVHEIPSVESTVTPEEITTAPQPTEVPTTEPFRCLTTPLNVNVPFDDKSSCAVVGGSTSLLHNKSGSLIDNHQVVIRMNAQPVKSFEEFVGSRTTIRLLYPESFHWEPTDEWTVFLWFKKADELYTQSIWNRSAVDTRHLWLKPHMTPGKHLFNRTLAVDPECVKEWDVEGQRSQSHRPTTGMLAIIMATHMCQWPVDAYGFSRPGEPYRHYYQTVKHFGEGQKGPKLNREHDRTVEFEVQKKLVQKGALNMIY